jgi:chromosome segregation ATPase
LTKSWIAGKAIEAQRAAHVAELENDNAQLRAELDVARSKLAEVEGRERALTFAYEEVKKDFNDLSSLHDAALKEKAERDAKVQRFQDSLRKRLAELRRETEGSMAMLGGRCAEFPADASVSDFLG